VDNDGDGIADNEIVFVRPTPGGFIQDFVQTDYGSIKGYPVVKVSAVGRQSRTQRTVTIETVRLPITFPHSAAYGCGDNISSGTALVNGADMPMVEPCWVGNNEPEIGQAPPGSCCCEGDVGCAAAEALPCDGAGLYDPPPGVTGVTTCDGQWANIGGSEVFGNPPYGVGALDVRALAELFEDFADNVWVNSWDDTPNSGGCTDVNGDIDCFKITKVTLTSNLNIASNRDLGGVLIVDTSAAGYQIKFVGGYTFYGLVLVYGNGSLYTQGDATVIGMMAAESTVTLGGNPYISYSSQALQAVEELYPFRAVAWQEEDSPCDPMVVGQCF